MGKVGYPNIASVPHSIVNGMKNCMSVAAVTEITFKEAEMMKEFLADPSKFAAVAAAPAAGAAAADAPAAAKVEEPEDKVTMTWDLVCLTKCRSCCQHEINVT